MNNEIGRLTAELSYQRKSIDALLSITEPGADSLSIEKISQRAIEPIQNITGFNTVAIRIYDQKEKCFRIVAQYGMTPEMIEKLKCRPHDSPNFLEVMNNKEPVVKTPQEFIRKLGYKKTTFVTMIAGDIVIGSIDMAKKEDYTLTQDEVRWFALVGRMLGSMIYQVQLMERLQSRAAIQERTRLAHELHDDVAQLVRSMKWGIEETQDALDNKELDRAAQVLVKLEDAVQLTSTYLKEEMLFLRERVDSNHGFISILEAMLYRFEHNWGIKTTLLSDQDASSNVTVFLSPQEEVQLIRIVQEALVNIRRHAMARTVTIKISHDADNLTLEIADDGVGFRVEDIPQESLGIRIIRERAASIGARIMIDSNEGDGTKLEIELFGKSGVIQ